MTNCKRTAIVVLLLFCFWKTNAANGTIDSLLFVYRTHTAEDTIRCRLINNLAGAYQYINTDSMLLYAEEGRTLAEKIGYPAGVANAYMQSGRAYEMKGEHDHALAVLFKALKICEENGLSKGLATTLNHIGSVYYQSCVYNKAIVYFKRSLEASELAADSESITGCIANIGATYQEMGKYADAMLYYFKGLRIAEAYRQETTVAMMYINIANMYLLIGKYSKAIWYAEKGLATIRSVNNPSWEAYALNIIGSIYAKNNDYARAEQNYRQALAIATRIKDMTTVADSYISLGEISRLKGRYDDAFRYNQQSLHYARLMGDAMYMAQSYLGLGESCKLQQRYAESISYLEQGLALSGKANMPSVMSEILQMLAEVSSITKDYRKAYEYQHLYTRYQDSLYKASDRESIQELHFDHELYKKQQEILMLGKERDFQEERSSKQRIISGGLVVILVLAILTIYVLVSGRQKEKKAMKLISEQKIEIQEQATFLREQNELKTKTFAVLSHDLRNPIAALSLLMEMENQKLITPEKLLEGVISINKQLYALNTALENLLVWSKHQMEGDSQVKARRVNLFMLAEQSIDLLHESALHKKLTISNQINHDAVVRADNDQLDIVIRNLLANAIKFTPEHGTVTIESSEQGDRIILSVRDTGIGMNEETIGKLFDHKQHFTSEGTGGERGTGLGLLICKEFVNKNGGNIVVESEEGKGSCFSFDLPKAG